MGKVTFTATVEFENESEVQSDLTPQERDSFFLLENPLRCERECLVEDAGNPAEAVQYVQIL